MAQVQVHNFSYGMLNPGLGYLMSCLGAFLGLRCLTRARTYTGAARAAWLLIASVAIGATGIWVMHFVAMLGFTIPGQEIMYNIPMTLISLVVAVVVVAIGLFIVGYSSGGLLPVLAGGVIIGVGVSTMHYVGMSAMSMQGTVRYNAGLVGVSVLIAIVAGTAALIAGLRVRGLWSSLGVSLIISVSPNEDEIRDDASLSERLSSSATVVRVAYGDPQHAFQVCRSVFTVGRRRLRPGRSQPSQAGRERQNSLPSGSRSTRWSSYSDATLAPSSVSRSSSSAKQSHRKSRWTRFFTIFGSATSWKKIRGCLPGASTRTFGSSSGSKMPSPRSRASSASS